MFVVLGHDVEGGESWRILGLVAVVPGAKAKTTINYWTFSQQISISKLELSVLDKYD